METSLSWGCRRVAQTQGTHENSEFKPPKAQVVLIWMSFLTLDFKHTLPPMIHSIILGVFGRAIYFQPAMWKPRGLPLVEIIVGQLVHAFPKVFTFEKEAVGHLILVMHV